MFHEDGTFNFHQEIMALAEEFCQEWVQRRGPFKNRLEGGADPEFRPLHYQARPGATARSTGMAARLQGRLAPRGLRTRRVRR